MRFLLLAIAIPMALLAAPALAQTADVSPVKVTADSFVVDDTSHLATFSGKVVVTRKGLNLWADKLVVEYGAAGQSDITGFTATGHVRIKTEDQDATGQRAIFDPKTQILRLLDDVTVVNAQGTVKGPELTIDLAANTSVFKSNAGGRVTGVFIPQ